MSTLPKFQSLSELTSIWLNVGMAAKNQIKYGLHELHRPLNQELKGCEGERQMAVTNRPVAHGFVASPSRTQTHHPKYFTKLQLWQKVA